MASQATAEINFKELVETYYAPLYRFAFSLAGNKEDAGDLTQQTFYIWAEKGSSLRQASKVKSWLFTTLYREFLRLKRQSSSTVSTAPEVIEREAPSVLPDVVSALDAAEAVECLHICLPHSRHRPRGSEQAITHSLLKTFKCRHWRSSTWSCSLTGSLPQRGQRSPSHSRALSRTRK